MSDGLMAVPSVGQPTMTPVFAQFGGSKSYWVDLVLIVVMFGLVIFVVSRASRRY